MLDFEYQNIIDYFTEQYSVYYSMEQRKSLIQLHKSLETLSVSHLVDFGILCEQLTIENYLLKKYPGFDLYNTFFSPMGQN